MGSIVAYGMKWWYNEARRDHRYPRRVMNGKTVKLHRYTWERERGPIPPGGCIHHVDGNTLNNAIENLQCIATLGAHISEHQTLERRRMHRAVANRVNAAPGAQSRNRKLAASMRAKMLRRACSGCPMILTTRWPKRVLWCTECRKVARRLASAAHRAKIAAHH
jgi:hypothetical protein